MLSTRHFTVSTAGHQMKKGTVSSSQELELWVDITCVPGSAVFSEEWIGRRMQVHMGADWRLFTSVGGSSVNLV